MDSQQQTLSDDEFQRRLREAKGNDAASEQASCECMADPHQIPVNKAVRSAPERAVPRYPRKG